MNTGKLDRFTRSYLETALWSSNDPGDDPLDLTFNIDDFSEEALARAVAECEDFQDQTDFMYSDKKQAGHDFWLTRNHHGAGFWDGDYPEYGEKLTAISEAFGEVQIYVGDDGLLYFE